MESKLREALKMELHPVAVLRFPALPLGYAALHKSRPGCVIAGIEEAARGETVVFMAEEKGCSGGKVGLGFVSDPPDSLAYFLSNGNQALPGLRYKKDHALGDAYVQSLPKASPAPCLVFKPLHELTPEETPVSVIFLVNADQLSGLVTLASYDQPIQDSVKIRFGAGCAQSVLYSVCDSEEGNDWCTIGITDPSGRVHLSKDLLSFSMPYQRFLTMESHVEGSFLSLPLWKTIQDRI
ncbi:MAG: DUF169 domain-containing protein [Evtepia sp.]|uniref:DUF169 domain-containing protein n=1 Tax=Evtepia sp. TaxID=2773933 RepID=UPI002A753668|nr:DUF169 domain-containing protein [Evtepia sp.]MDY3013608.1 DUF169 domain-containing protein [Evtepia sp.]